MTMLQPIALILGKNGLMLGIGSVIFLFSYFHSVKLFQWIEDQTLGNREYILEKLEQLFIRIDPDKVTYVLLFLSFGLSFITLLVFMFLGHWHIGLVLGIALGVVGWKVPRPIVDYLVEKRILIYQSQMVDALTLLGNGLRAGLSLPQSFGMVIDEMPNPIAQEFRLILEQNKIGVPLEECLENLVKRIPIPDNEMFVTSINILRETGGNLPEVFDTIVDVIRERVRLQQKIDSLTASGKVQALIISLMPTGMLLVYSLSDPDSMANVFKNPIGLALLVGAYVLNIIGYVAIRKVIAIKA